MPSWNTACGATLNAAHLTTRTEATITSRSHPTPKRIGVGCEREVIVASVRVVRCAAFRVAPHAVFQDGIPDKTSPRVTISGVLIDPCRIDCPRKSCSLLHRGQQLLF